MQRVINIHSLSIRFCGDHGTGGETDRGRGTGDRGKADGWPGTGRRGAAARRKGIRPGVYIPMQRTIYKKGANGWEGGSLTGGLEIDEGRHRTHRVI